MAHSNKIWAPISLLAGLLVGCSGALDESAERSASASAEGINSVRIIAEAGDLEVIGQAGLAEVNAAGTARASSVSRLDDIRFVLSINGSEMVIEARTPASNTEFDVVITIPDTVDVEITDGSGNIEVRDIGSVRLTDGSGDVVIDRVSADVVIEDDGSGSLSISAVSGSVEIEQDGSGNIDIGSVTGDVRIGDDGSGDVDIEDVVGSVAIGDDGSGDITVSDVGGDFTVGRDGSGSINHSNVGGTVDIP